MIDNHIKIASGFSIGSREPVDARFILSKEDMAKVGDASQGADYALARWPYHYFVLCEDDGQIYEFRHDDVTCSFTRVTRKIDNRTILETSEYVAYVPIDEQTIVVNSEGKLSAVPEPLVDGIATEAVNLADGTAKVNVLFDPNTIELLAALNQLKVKVDNDTIKVGSEGLFADFEGHVDDVTIKFNSEGKLEGQYTANEDKALHLAGTEFEVKVDNDTVKFNSEGKLVADFIRYVGSEGVEVDDNVIKAVVDDATIKVVNGALEVQAKEAVGVDADGLYVKMDGHTVVLQNSELNVPLADLIHEDSEHVIKVVEGPADEVTLKLIHDDTLVVTSEGKLHVVARQAVASEGIIVVPVGETSIISADFDHKTIVLGSEGMMVNIYPKHGLKLATGAGGAPLGIKADIDEVTINYNSEGKLVATSTPVEVLKPLKKRTAADGTITLSVGYDGKTIKLDNSELYVPFDSETIYYDILDGFVKARKQLYTDELTIVEDSEHTLHVNIDGKTIIYNSESGKVETMIGGWKEAATHKDYIDSTVSVTPGATFVRRAGTNIFTAKVPFALIEKPLDRAEADLVVTLRAGTGTVLTTTDSVILSNYGGIFKASAGLNHELIDFEYDTQTHEISFEYDVDALTANNMPLVDSIQVALDGMATGYHTIDANYVPIDNDSIIIRNGVLVTAAPSITAGDGLEYVITPTANILNVLTDSETVDIRADHLYIPVLADHTSSEQDLVLAINSEGKPQFLKRAGVTDVLIDGESLVENYVVVIPNASDSERGVVKFDNDTLVLNSEGQLKVVNLVENVFVKELDSEGSEGERSVLDSERIARIDLTPYSKLDETGYRIRLLVDGQEADSEGVYDSESNYIITAELYDQAGNLLTTSNPLDLPMEHAIAKVGYRLLPPDSEGIRETVLIFTDLAEKVYEVPLGTMSGFVRQHADYLDSSPNGSISGRWNFSNELYNHGFEVVTQVQFDEANLTFNDSENFVELIPYVASEGIEITGKRVARTNKGGDTIYPTEYTIKAKFDHETIKLNAAEEMEVPIDKKTIITSEGKVVVNLDKKTIIYDDSEGHIELPIDEVTIFINSEGLLEAAGMDVKPGDAIKISTSEEAGLPVKYLDVLYDDETIKLNSENELYVPIDEDSIIINSEQLLEVHQYTVAEIRALWHAICSEGEA